MDDEFASDPFNPPSAAQERGDMRDSMFLQASMRLADGTSVSLRVRNLSAGGLMADCAIGVEQGEAVEIGLRNIGAVPGEIAWIRGQRIGVAFLERIDPRVARKSVAAHAGEAMIVPRATQLERRPGLKIK